MTFPNGAVDNASPAERNGCANPAAIAMIVYLVSADN